MLLHDQAHRRLEFGDIYNWTSKSMLRLAPDQLT